MKYSLAVILLCLLPGGLAAQQERRLSIDELFRLGMEHSLRVQAASIREDIASEQEASARTARLPELNLGASAGYLGQPTLFSRGLADATHPDAPDWSQNYNAEVLLPVYQGGRIRYNIHRASLEKQLARLDAANDIAEVKMTLLRAYINLYSLYKQKELYARNIDESEHRLEDIRRMRREGVLTRNDELRSELQLTNDRLAARQTEDDIAIMSQQLDLILGLDEALLIVPDTGALVRPAELQEYAAYLDKAYEDYPELNIARQNTRLAETDVKINRSNYLPSISLRGANTLARPVSSSMQDRFINNWNIGLSLSFRLSALYQNRHNVQAARHTAALRSNAEQQVMQALRINVRSAYIRHQEALDRIHALELSVRQSEENYRIVQNRYLNQLSILTDLLDAISVRSEAELQLTTARAGAIYTYYELQRACGNL